MVSFIQKHRVLTAAVVVAGLLGISVLLAGIVAVGRFGAGLPVAALCAALVLAVAGVALLKGRLVAYAMEDASPQRLLLALLAAVVVCYLAMESFFSDCFAGLLTGGQGPQAAVQLYALLPLPAPVKGMALKLAAGAAAVVGVIPAVFIAMALLRFFSGALTGGWAAKAARRGGLAARLGVLIARRPGALIFLFLSLQLAAGLPEKLHEWARLWYVVDYTIGFGPRLFVGSLVNMLFGPFIYDRQVYALVVVTLLADIALVAFILGRAIRTSPPQTKRAVAVLAAIYTVSPFSVAYLWNNENIGRLDTFLVLFTLLAVVAWLNGKNRRLVWLALGGLSVCGVLTHQVYVFIFFPLVFSLMCVDIFRYDHLDKSALRWGAAVCAATAAAFLLCQFGAALVYPTLEELTAYLAKKTDLWINDFVLDLEYYLPFSGKLGMTAEFYQNDHPFGHSLATLLLLAPWLAILGRFARDQLRAAKPLRENVCYGPELYIFLSGLMFLPVFAIMVDWGRWFAPLFANGVFIIVCLTARRNAPATTALAAMDRHILKTPELYVFTIGLFLCLDKFMAPTFIWQARQLYAFAAQLAGRAFG